MFFISVYILKYILRKYTEEVETARDSAELEGWGDAALKRH